MEIHFIFCVQEEDQHHLIVMSLIENVFQLLLSAGPPLVMNYIGPWRRAFVGILGKRKCTDIPIKWREEDQYNSWMDWSPSEEYSNLIHLNGSLANKRKHSSTLIFDKIQINRSLRHLSLSCLSPGPFINYKWQESVAKEEHLDLLQDKTKSFGLIDGYWDC